MNDRYISYNVNKDKYVVRVKVDGKFVSRLCDTVEDARITKAKLLKANSLTTAILTKTKKKTEKTKKQIFEEMTFREAFLYFCKYRQREVKISSFTCYRTSFHLVEKYIANVKVSQITHEMLADVFDVIQDTKNVSKSYLKCTYGRIKLMYQWYINEEYTDINPCSKPIPLRKTQATKRRAFTKQEIQKFFQTAKLYVKYSLYLLFYTYYVTGCRKAELACLQWQDVNFEDETININKAVNRGLKDGETIETVGTPKTVASVRIIPIPTKLRNALYLYHKLRGGADTDFIWCGTKFPYKPIQLNHIDERFRYVRDKAGLPDELTLHCFRHTFASKLINSGVDVVTAKALTGHASTRTLLDIYTHADEEKKRQAIRNIFH